MPLLSLSPYVQCEPTVQSLYTIVPVYVEPW